MSTAINCLILGASYGSLLASKITLAGHNATMVCTADGARLINAEGTRVHLPVRTIGETVTLDSRDAPGQLFACTPGECLPAGYDLAILAMQEPQYSSPGVRELLERIAQSGIPTMSVMNMPPLPFLRRLPGLDVDALRDCFSAPDIWNGFDPARFTLASPDPQAFRTPEGPKNELHVGLPTNFKVAPFDDAEATAMLRQLQHDIEAVRYTSTDGDVELPVKIKLHDSVFVPLAKWSMLMTGNYRCVLDNDVRPIRDAVLSDIDTARAVYDWVSGLCIALGAQAQDLVPFEKYARAAESLGKPSSAARALVAGVPQIERVDRIVQAIGAIHGGRLADVDATVARVDAWLERNQAAAAA